MADCRKVVFPCDHASWPDVKAVLLSVKSSCGIESWLSAFQKAHDIMHSDVCSTSAETNLGAKSKTRNVFARLRLFFDSGSSAEECYKCIDHIFPLIVDLALEIENLRPSEGLETLCKLKEGSRVISKRLAASIVSCAFLCLFPGRCPALGIRSRLNTCSFDDFFHHLDCEFQCEKLRRILHYFSTVHELQSLLLENLVFSRKVLGHDLSPKLEDWMCSSRPLCPVVVHVSSFTQPTITGRKLQVIFGNRHYGGSALGAGRSQEDLWFCEAAELISGVLFIESLAENEALIVRGSRRAFSSVSQSVSATNTVSSGLALQAEVEDGTEICIIDPPMSGSVSEVGQAFKRQNILGLLRKMLAGFNADGRWTSQPLPVESLAVASGSSDEATAYTECSSALEEDVTVETGETDLLSSGSVGSSEHQAHPSKPSLENELMARLSSRRPRRPKVASSWRSNSSSESSNSFPDSLSRAMSLEVDSSTCHTPEEAPLAALLHRRSSALHSGGSSRRGSAVQWQQSLASEAGDAPGYGAYGRRRSSGMSDASRRSSSSSGSSAGKWSSTDYSSEMEEYSESFQRSIIKTSVIEEESGAVSLQEDEVTGAAAGIFGSAASGSSDPGRSHSTRSKMLQKFSIEHPKNVAKPTPIRFSAATPFFPNPVPASHHTALDHFVDNLINEVAQDSKLEIEELVKEQQMKVSSCRNAPGEVSSTRWPSYQKSASPLSDLADAGTERICIPDKNTHKPVGGFKSSEHSQGHTSFPTHLKNLKTGYPLLAKSSKPSEKKPSSSQTSKHCYSCDQFKEDVNEFVTGFLSNVFSEAIDVYCCHFGGFPDDRKKRSLVEELWVSPSSVLAPQHRTVSSTGHKSSDGAEAGTHPRENKIHRLPGLFYSQSCDEDNHHLQPKNALCCPGSLLSSGGGKRRASLDLPKQGGHIRDMSQSTPSVSQLWSDVSSREYFMNWFGSSRSSYVEKPPTSLDWFAKDLVVDAFDGAFVDLFGSAFLQGSGKKLRVNTSSELEYLPSRASESAEKPDGLLLSYAENLAQTILSSGSREAAQHLSASGSQGHHGIDLTKTRSGIRFAPKPNTFVANTPAELEEIASEFAHQVIEEAVHLVVGSGPVPRSELSVVTGHCHFGAYCGEPQLFALIQWIAASMAQVSELHYQTHGNTQIGQMDVICQIVHSRQLTVGALLSEIFVWCKRKSGRTSDVESLFDFLLIRLT